MPYIGGITFEKTECKCTSCEFVIAIERRNEQENGAYDLKIWCQLASCPDGGDMYEGEK